MHPHCVARHLRYLVVPSGFHDPLWHIERTTGEVWYYRWIDTHKHWDRKCAGYFNRPRTGFIINIQINMRAFAWLVALPVFIISCQLSSKNKYELIIRN